MVVITPRGVGAAAALAPSMAPAPVLRVRTRRPMPRLNFSLTTKLVSLLLVFLMVPAILYDVFREADATKNALLIRSAQEEGLLITLALRPMLSNATAPSTDLSDVLQIVRAHV